MREGVRDVGGSEEGGRGVWGSHGEGVREGSEGGVGVTARCVSEGRRSGVPVWVIR